MTTPTPRARCAATGELMTSDMTIVPGVALLCELSLGHRRECEWCRWEDGYGARKPLEHRHPEQHEHTLRWSDPMADELAEVLDPDEEFDLEVDIAPAEVIEHQARVTADAEPVECSGCSMPSGKHWDTCPNRPIPEAAPRCSVCGREVRPWRSGNDSGWDHVKALESPASHIARVD